MISPNNLKIFPIFNDLDETQLAQIADNARSLEFEADSVIFREGEVAEQIYLLSSGKILLEQKIAANMIVTVDTLKPGEIFGTASIMGIDTYTLDAVSAEKSDVITINSHVFTDLLSKNPSMGYSILKNLCISMKKQLTERTDLFIRSISNHPDFSELKP
ncbi:MAG: cyclic nucleotide-binding domain-containing protein [Desulfobacteraceae bacterium]|nr:cyclic nucleotide-binding domain-containing protein [Desulfobacteraceae bacterium]